MVVGEVLVNVLLRTVYMAVLPEAGVVAARRLVVLSRENRKAMVKPLRVDFIMDGCMLLLRKHSLVSIALYDTNVKPCRIESVEITKIAAERHYGQLTI